MTQVTKKTALIIGGTSGIGKATVQDLLKENVTVHIVGRNLNKIENHPNLVKHQVDISNPTDVNEFLKTIRDIEKIDYLVNASGIFSPKPFLEHTIEAGQTHLKPF
ncbi:MAG: SDR family oxidoreductase [Flavobacteriaceae bacterium]|nr:SDR family oxidoreductase [Flavobacteriaceae bacterium]